MGPVTSLHIRLPFPLGDQVAFSGVIREFRRSHPPEVFPITLDVPVPEVWRYNPRVILSRRPRGGAVLEIDGQFTFGANARGRHMVFGMAEVLSRAVGVDIVPRDVRGEIFLSVAERRVPSPVAEAIGEEIPYWILCNGGKFDRTVKWWPDEHYQAVVDAFRGRIQFVQVGGRRHYHPRLEGTLDLRGWTGVRSLIRLMHRAEGVVCPITGIMHLAAAVPGPESGPPSRACVVIGGGIEPVHWSTYPGYDFLSTVGQLECTGGGCWRCRTRTLGDGADQDSAASLCVDVDRGFARCMRQLGPEAVIAVIERRLASGACSWLSRRHRALARPVVKSLIGSAFDRATVSRQTLALAMDHFTASLCSGGPARGAATDGLAGQGIVSLANGPDATAAAWVLLRLVRRIGCELPMELWTDGWLEARASGWRRKFRRLGCRVRRLDELEGESASGVESRGLRAKLVRRSRFAEVLWLDSNCFPTADPAALFAWDAYRGSGMVLWPDVEDPRTVRRLLHPRNDAEPVPDSRLAWRVFGVEPPPGPVSHGGVFLVDRVRGRAALELAGWCEAHRRVFQSLLEGDRDLHRLACLKTGVAYQLAGQPAVLRERALDQVTAPGLVSLCLRVACPLTLSGPNQFVSWFPHERACHDYLAEFREGLGGSTTMRRARADPRGRE